jgi:hypothetical protein
LAKKDEAVAAKKKSVEARKLIFKRAEQYAKEYAEKDTSSSAKPYPQATSSTKPTPPTIIQITSDLRRFR